MWKSAEALKEEVPDPKVATPRTPKNNALGNASQLNPNNRQEKEEAGVYSELNFDEVLIFDAFLIVKFNDYFLFIVAQPNS